MNQLTVRPATVAHTPGPTFGNACGPRPHGIRTRTRTAVEQA
ncbi:hypothetical protein AB0O91_06555 [Kitasatospora sp. NPDC089797]